MATPSTQKNRPIGFALDDSSAPDGFYAIQNLVIRPEDLTRMESTRSEVVQTLGGGFADVWGRGLPTITIAGHTGWRGSPTRDGVQLFGDLRSLVMDQYTKRREDAAAAGRDPSTVKLIFVDVLDDFAYVVVPASFVLRRSRSRPLLCQYQITLRAVSGDLDEAKFRFVSEANKDVGTESMLDSLSQINRIMDGLGWVGKNFPEFAKALIGFVGKTQGILNQVLAIKGQVDAAMQPLFKVADLATQAARNIARSISTLAGLPMHVRSQLQQLGNAFHNCFCILRNSFRVRASLPDYSALYGASTCSSTSGGAPLSPLRGVNAFELLSPVSAQNHVTSGGLAALSLAAGNDPVLRPMSVADATYYMEQINA